MLNVIERPGYVVVELNYPPANILSMAVLQELSGAFARVASSQARGMLLRGAGRHFSGGADVGEHLPGQVETMLPLFSKTIEALLALEIPTLADVQGAAMGGGFELAFGCDFVIAREDARLGLPEITLGVFPPVAAALLPALIGTRRTLELLMTGKPIPAAKALEMGLLNRIGSAEEAEKFMSDLVRLPRPALVACKRATLQPARERLAFAEKVYLQELMSHSEPVEGLRAFLEKRSPMWSPP